MEKFLLYLYYRSEKIKNRYLALRPETPVAFFSAINSASLLIFIMKLLALSGIIKGFATTRFCIVLTGVLWVSLIIFVPVYMYVNRKKVHKIISAFEQETAAEKKKNGGKIVRYIFISFITIVVAFLL
jgi:hypothetical protein